MHIDISNIDIPLIDIPLTQRKFDYPRRLIPPKTLRHTCPTPPRATHTTAAHSTQHPPATDYSLAPTIHTLHQLPRSPTLATFATPSTLSTNAAAPLGSLHQQQPRFHTPHRPPNPRPQSADRTRIITKKDRKNSLGLSNFGENKADYKITRQNTRL